MRGPKGGVLRKKSSPGCFMATPLGAPLLAVLTGGTSTGGALVQGGLSGRRVRPVGLLGAVKGGHGAGGCGGGRAAAEAVCSAAWVHIHCLRGDARRRNPGGFQGRHTPHAWLRLGWNVNGGPGKQVSQVVTRGFEVGIRGSAR